MNTRIIHMSESYKVQLIEYMHKIYPTFSDSFIEFDVNEAIGDKDGESNSLLVINDNNSIVGCHLNYNTKAWIYGKEENIAWGHNTFLDKEYRKEIGLDFILEIAKIKNGFGHGLSQQNIKIQKKFKYSAFANGVRKYNIINHWAIWDVFKSKIGFTNCIPSTLPHHIRIGNTLFSICIKADDLSIPQNGFWNKDVYDIDFIRDKEFLNKRFFNNPVHKYFIYTNQSKNSYFVVRPTIYKDIRALILADFRYIPNNTITVNNIFNAAEKLSKKIHAGLLLFTTSDTIIKKEYAKRWFCKSYPDIVNSGKHILKNASTTINISSADSDEEYYL